ncbi:MAG: GNAT family protein [bacterium]|jgi:ribosomal-protein-alanine N-acetyltransferase
MGELAFVVGRSERIVLRRLNMDDLPELKRALVENEDWLRPWLPAPMRDPRIEEHLKYDIARGVQEWETDEAYRLGIFKGDELIGRVSHTLICRGNFQNSNCGYWIAQSHIGNGYAPEAVALSLDYVFKTLALHRVHFAVMPENPRSMRVMEKLEIRHEGFSLRYLQIGGEWRDHHLYAVLADEWKGRRGLDD